MIDGHWSYKFVIDENCRWNWPLVQNVEADLYQSRTITFGEKSNRTYKPGICLAYFSPALGRSILSHDGTSIASASFLKTPQRTNSADIIDGAYKYATGT